MNPKNKSINPIRKHRTRTNTKIFNKFTNKKFKAQRSSTIYTFNFQYKLILNFKWKPKPSQFFQFLITNISKWKPNQFFWFLNTNISNWEAKPTWINQTTNHHHCHQLVTNEHIKPPQPTPTTNPTNDPPLPTTSPTTTSHPLPLISSPLAQYLSLNPYQSHIPTRSERKPKERERYFDWRERNL